MNAKAVDARAHIRPCVLGLTLLILPMMSGAAVTPSDVPMAVAALPLASYANGQAMMDTALKGLVLDIDFKFLAKTYKKDVYVREPVTGKKVRVSCVRFKATSGFRFKTDPPKYQLSAQGGLTIEHNIAKLDQDGLTVKFQLGPCHDIAGGYGFRVRDAKLIYRARPMISFQDGGCKVSLNPYPGETHFSIGDLNILGVQNDLDKLAKDAVREALNVTLANFFNSGLASGLTKAAINVCGGASKPGR